MGIKSTSGPNVCIGPFFQTPEPGSILIVTLFADLTGAATGAVIAKMYTRVAFALHRWRHFEWPIAQMRILAHRHHVSRCIRFENLRVLLSMDVDAARSSVMQPENRVVHQKERARNRRSKFHHSRTACWNQGSLKTACRRRKQIPFSIHFVEDLSDHVERGN